MRIKVATEEEKRIIKNNISFLEKEFEAKTMLDEMIKREPKPWKPIIRFQF